MKRYTDDSAEPHCSGVKPEKVKFSDRKYWRMQRNKFRWFVKVWRLHNLDRRAMRIKEGETFSFEVGDFVYLNVSPMRGTRRFKVKEKLTLRYVGPFKIVDRR
jgi:hypothetical protein